MVEQPFLNSTKATCHILKRTQVNPLCLSRNNPIACTRARPLSRRGCTWPQPIRGANPGPHAPRPVVSPLGHKGRPDIRPTSPNIPPYHLFVVTFEVLFHNEQCALVGFLDLLKLWLVERALYTIAVQVYQRVSNRFRCNLSVDDK